MSLIDACFDFYIDNLDSYAPVKDELIDYTCEVERHGFNAGFRFAFAMQLMQGNPEKFPMDYNSILEKMEASHE